MDEYQERDSGWALTGITHLEININQYKPFRSGSQYIMLPEKIQNKKACINVKNYDEFCFKWAVISALFPVNIHSDRPKSYCIHNIRANTIVLRNGIKLEFKNLEFPLKLNHISKFEEINPNISTNVFGLENDNIVGPFYCTKLEKEVYINLLLLDKDDRSHYVWIKNMSRLLGNTITKSKKKLYMCNFCLIHFYSEEKLFIHKRECNRVVTIMPTSENFELEFKNYERQIEVPFVVYADFECLLLDIDTCSPDSTISSTTNVQEHVPCAFAYYLKCSFDNRQNKLQVYKGENCTDQFVKVLLEDIQHIYNEIIMKPKSMENFNEEQHMQTTICHICKKELDNNDKVADHCHFTGKYRGAAHRTCNSLYRIPNFIPIFFHNFSGYDCHLFVKSLEKIDGSISVIPLNKELYISLTKQIMVNNKKTVNLRFLDSFRFMQSSLEALAQNLSTNDFHTVKSVSKNEEQFKLLIRKGVLPYEYLNSWQRLEETSLPLQEKFYSKLLKKTCSDEDLHFLAYK